MKGFALNDSQPVHERSKKKSMECSAHLRNLYLARAVKCFFALSAASPPRRSHYTRHDDRGEVAGTTETAGEEVVLGYC